MHRSEALGSGGARQACRVAAAGLTILLLAACNRPIAGPAAVAATAAVATDRGSSGGSAVADQDLAALRQATVRFHDFDAAKAAGYTDEVTNCLDDLPAGAMGYHYGNDAYIQDPVPDVRKPELLMYEPDKHGRMQLVGVEYIIPYTLVPASTDPAPTLFGGVSFHHNDAFGIWALHAWVWKENPGGVFADWNPKVTCAYAGGDVTHLGATP
jgi:hypothetical protein